MKDLTDLNITTGSETDCASQCDEAVCYCKSNGLKQYSVNGCTNNATIAATSTL